MWGAAWRNKSAFGLQRRAIVHAQHKAYEGSPGQDMAIPRNAKGYTRGRALPRFRIGAGSRQKGGAIMWSVGVLMDGLCADGAQTKHNSTPYR